MVADAEIPGLDLDRFVSYLDSERPGLLAGRPHAELIVGGRSNLTYRLDDGRRSWVLRRPPLGHVLATAHDMSREYRVITALAGTPVPVPRAELLCTDADVLGAPFYLMQYMPGTVIRTSEQGREFSQRQRRGIGFELIDVLALLHSVDPAAVGLAEFGRPDGYLARQVARWRKQLDASRSRELSGVDELQGWLVEHLPASRQATVVHGDYRLGNVLFDGKTPSITAVLDWEMATLGDPLADLGLLYVYWECSRGEQDPIGGGVTALPGFPGWEELAQRYAQRTGRSLDRLNWYLALAHFKIAVVLEGIYYRYRHGDTVGTGFDRIGAMVQPLINRGLVVRGLTR